VGTPHEDRREQARRAVGKLAQAGGRAASAAASRAARRADETVRGALPGGIRGGARFTGSRFQRELGTAMATRPHARTASTLLLGTAWQHTPFGHTRAQRKKIRTDGFDTTSRPDLPLDVAELAHIHGTRLPSIMSVAFLHRRETLACLLPASREDTYNKRLGLPKTLYRKCRSFYRHFCRGQCSGNSLLSTGFHTAFP